MNFKVRIILGLSALVGVALFLAGCKTHVLSIPDPQGIATAQYILRLEIVPDSIDINNFGTATADLRAHLTDWNGSNLAGKTIFFEVIDFQIGFSASSTLTTTTREKETQQDCNLSGTSCTSTCGPVVTTKNNTDTNITTTQSLGCTAILNAEILGRINTRYVKTGTDGMAITTYFPFPSHKVNEKIQDDLEDDVMLCAAVSLNLTLGTSTEVKTEQVDIDGDGTNDVCRTTITTKTTDAKVENVAYDLPNFFFVPIMATWTETSYPEQVSDTNPLKLGFYQWNND